jgi:PAS domain S-box-containing protein
MSYAFMFATGPVKSQGGGCAAAGVFSCPPYLPLFHERVDISQSNRSLRKEMDESGMMVWLAAANSKNTYVSPYIVTYTGRSRPEMRGFKWVEAVHPDDREGVIQQYLQAVKERRAFCIKFRMLRVDRRHCDVVNYGVPRLRNGRFLGYVGTIHEIQAGLKWRDMPGCLLASLLRAAICNSAISPAERITCGMAWIAYIQNMLPPQSPSPS